MLKIIKHEFIKSRAGMLALAIIAAALYLMSLLGDQLQLEWMKYVSLVLLIMYAFASYLYALIRGITAYSAELKDRTGYLLMMTPHNTYSILFGKLIFSFALAAVMLVISVLAASGALANLFGSRVAIRGYYNILREMALRIGINPDQVIAFITLSAISTLINMVSLVSLGYFATTISATIFQNKKGHGFITFLLFIAMFVALSVIEYYLLPSSMRTAVMVADNAINIMRQIIPTLIFNLIAICGLTCAGAALLKRRVCL